MNKKKSFFLRNNFLILTLGLSTLSTLSLFIYLLINNKKPHLLKGKPGNLFFNSSMLKNKFQNDDPILSTEEIEQKNLAKKVFSIEKYGHLAEVNIDTSFNFETGKINFEIGDSLKINSLFDLQNEFLIQEIISSTEELTLENILNFNRNVNNLETTLLKKELFLESGNLKNASGLYDYESKELFFVLSNNNILENDVFREQISIQDPLFDVNNLLNDSVKSLLKYGDLRKVNFMFQNGQMLIILENTDSIEEELFKSELKIQNPYFEINEIPDYIYFNSLDKHGLLNEYTTINYDFDIGEILFTNPTNSRVLTESEFDKEILNQKLTLPKNLLPEYRIANSIKNYGDLTTATATIHYETNNLFFFVEGYAVNDEETFKEQIAIQAPNFNITTLKDYNYAISFQKYGLLENCIVGWDLEANNFNYLTTNKVILSDAQFKIEAPKQKFDIRNIEKLKNYEIANSIKTYGDLNSAVAIWNSANDEINFNISNQNISINLDIFSREKLIQNLEIELNEVVGYQKSFSQKIYGDLTNATVTVNENNTGLVFTNPNKETISEEIFDQQVIIQEPNFNKNDWSEYLKQKSILHYGDLRNLEVLLNPNKKELLFKTSNSKFLDEVFVQKEARKQGILINDIRNLNNFNKYNSIINYGPLQNSQIKYFDDQIYFVVDNFQLLNDTDFRTQWNEQKITDTTIESLPNYESVISQKHYGDLGRRVINITFDNTEGKYFFQIENKEIIKGIDNLRIERINQNLKVLPEQTFILENIIVPENKLGFYIDFKPAQILSKQYFSIETYGDLKTATVTLDSNLQEVLFQVDSKTTLNNYNFDVQFAIQYPGVDLDTEKNKLPGYIKNKSIEIHGNLSEAVTGFDTAINKMIVFVPHYDLLTLEQFQLEKVKQELPDLDETTFDFYEINSSLQNYGYLSNAKPIYDRNSQIAKFLTTNNKLLSKDEFISESKIQNPNSNVYTHLLESFKTYEDYGDILSYKIKTDKNIAKPFYKITFLEEDNNISNISEEQFIEILKIQAPNENISNLFPEYAKLKLLESYGPLDEVSIDFMNNELVFQVIKEGYETFSTLNEETFFQEIAKEFPDTPITDFNFFPKISSIKNYGNLKRAEIIWNSETNQKEYLTENGFSLSQTKFNREIKKQNYVFNENDFPSFAKANSLEQFGYLSLAKVIFVDIEKKIKFDLSNSLVITEEVFDEQIAIQYPDFNKNWLLNYPLFKKKETSFKTYGDLKTATVNFDSDGKLSFSITNKTPINEAIFDEQIAIQDHDFDKRTLVNYTKNKSIEFYGDLSQENNIIYFGTGAFNPKTEEIYPAMFDIKKSKYLDWMSLNSLKSEIKNQDLEWNIIKHQIISKKPNENLVTHTSVLSHSEPIIPNNLIPNNLFIFLGLFSIFLLCLILFKKKIRKI